MNDHERTRIHHYGQAPFVSGHQPIGISAQQASAYAQPFVEPEPAPVFSLFERALFIIMCLTTTVASGMFIVVVVQVYLALQDLQEKLSQIPGFGN